MSRTKDHPPLKQRLFDRPHLERPHFDRPHLERPHFDRPHFDYAHFAQTHVGSRLTRALRLPRPAVLRRYDGEPVIDGVVVIDGYAEAVVAARLRDALGALGITVADAPPDPPAVASVAAVIVDMTSMTTPEQLETLRAIVAPALRSLAPSGRVIAIVRPPEESSTAAMAAARRGVDGIIRSLAKELREGGTANTVEIANLADEAVDATVRFLLSGRSAYVPASASASGPRSVRWTSRRTGPTRWRGRSPSLPARRRASARPSPTRSPATAHVWSASTCPRSSRS